MNTSEPRQPSTGRPRSGGAGDPLDEPARAVPDEPTPEDLAAWMAAAMGEARSALEHGDDEIKDSTLREYYQHLRRVVRGPLWSGERWRSIWLLNSGRLRPPG